MKGKRDRTTCPELKPKSVPVNLVFISDSATLSSSDKNLEKHSRMRQVKKKNVNFPGHSHSSFSRSERSYQRANFIMTQWQGIGRAVILSRFTMNPETVTLFTVPFQQENNDSLRTYQMQPRKRRKPGCMPIY